MRLSGMVERRAVGDVGFGMVYCPPGEFWMGTDQNVRYGYENPRHEHPRHRVSLTRGVWMGQTQVTQELWEAVMGENPSYFKGAQRPVENVSWLDCVRFCNKLSELEGLVPAYKIDLSNDRIVRLKMKANGYRLPTEAEWEYAAKSGTELMYSGGNSLDDVAWCWGNSERQTHPVAQKQANAWGIYDMTGNVMEWCSDSWSAEAYSGRISCEDPIEYNVHASKRVLRGGNFGRGPDRCRVACRHWCDFERRKSSFGFRLLRCEP
jgi:formylglycine-generating enzyme required for sulfatase activity